MFGYFAVVFFALVTCSHSITTEEALQELSVRLEAKNHDVSELLDDQTFWRSLAGQQLIVEYSVRGIFPEIDREASMTACEIVAYRGYSCEEHTAFTNDKHKFKLKLHRIPNYSGTKPPVLLMHGLLSSSVCWLDNLAHQSLGYILSDAGFDVWLGNMRGNVYARESAAYQPKDTKFWTWSWDEMAAYDLPAIVDKIIATTGKPQVYYVGHSQGGMVALAGLANNQALNRKIKRFFALAPASFLKNIGGPIKKIAPLTNTLSKLFALVGYKEFAPHNTFFNLLAKGCSLPIQGACKNLMVIIAGGYGEHTNITRLPVYLSQFPAGTSTQNIVHFGQAVNSGEFQMHNHGKLGNLARYGQSVPPHYDVSRISTPVHVFWGGHDALTTPSDVGKLIEQLGSTVVQNVFIHDYAHQDFIWGTNAKERIYDKIIDQMNNDG